MTVTISRFYKINKGEHHVKIYHFYFAVLFLSVILFASILYYTSYYIITDNLPCSSQSSFGSAGVRFKANCTSRSLENLVSQRLPNCIIVGVRKCGTRALLEFLDIHPLIQKVTNEIHFFDDNQKYNHGLEWYRHQMPWSNNASVIIEKTPAYFVTDSVPERIYSMNSSIKIILIVRDPVTRLISDYAQLTSNKIKKDRPVQSFEEVTILPNGKVNSAYKAIRIGMYAIYYLRWITLFSRNQIYVVDGDQFVYDPLPEVKRIESFLGLPHYIERDHFVYNVTKGFFCIRQADDTGRCLNKSKGRKHPEISPLVVRKLRAFYAPYNKYFYRLVGKQFLWPE